jgi:hypothetical protein
MPVTQAIEGRARRFIPILREQLALPADIAAFVSVDMTPRHEMQFSGNMKRLIRRLKRPPNEP